MIKEDFKMNVGDVVFLNSNPEILELLNENQELEKVEELNGVIFYKIVNKGA